MEDYNGFEYVGDVPTVYKGAAYEVYYEPLYVRRVSERFFYAVKTENGLEAVADDKDGSIEMLRGYSPFRYNAENSNICVLIPDYTL